MCRGQVLCCRVVGLHKLPDGHVCRLRGIHLVRCLSRGELLRIDGPDRCVGNLRGGLILGFRGIGVFFVRCRAVFRRGCERLFSMRGRAVFGVCGHLVLQLPGGLLRGGSGGKLLGLRSRHVSDDGRAECVRKLRRGHVLVRICCEVHQLRCGHVPGEQWPEHVRLVRRRLLPVCHWGVGLRELPRRELLRCGGANDCCRYVRSGGVLGRGRDVVHYLRVGLLRFLRGLAALHPV